MTNLVSHIVVVKKFKVSVTSRCKKMGSVYAASAQVITSMITYIELTTQPARLGDHQPALNYRDYLAHSENINLFPVDLKIADQAVIMRAQHGFKTPDAIQIGTAVACGADYIVTNDRKWKRFDAIPVLLMFNLHSR